MNDEEVKQQAQLENSPDTDDMGAIKVADEVLSIVAGLAASEVNGVYGMSGGIREGLTDMLGKQNFSKGIKVYKTFVGEYMTSLEMEGFSVSLLRLDDELKALLDAHADTIAFKA